MKARYGAQHEIVLTMEVLEYEQFLEWIRLHKDSLNGIQDPAAKPTKDMLGQLYHELSYPRAPHESH